MEKLFEKLDILKHELDNNVSVKEIKRLNKLVSEDKELNKLLEEYQSTKDERIKKEILKSSLFQEYKHHETEINILILKINQELKKIRKKDNCGI